MAEAAKRVKASELFRERTLAKFYGALQDVGPLNTADTSCTHVPRSSTDTTLTALVQLATLRLDTSRALISLIDATHQYVLAEATKSLSLQSDCRHDANDGLWLGAVKIPRDHGACGFALENALQVRSAEESGESEDLTVIPDIQNDPRTAAVPFLASRPGLRFYAGVPLRTPDGAIIGILCVYDDKPRHTLTDEHRIILRDISVTAMDHLDAVRVRRAQARCSNLISGLESFVDGLTQTRTATESATNNTSYTQQGNSAEVAMRDIAAETKATNADGKGASNEPSDQDALGLDAGSYKDLAMPPGSRSMFARAANVIRQAGDYDGCAIFYVSSSNKTGNRSGANHTDINIAAAAGSDDIQSDVTETDERSTSASETDDSTSSSRFSSTVTCPLLSFSLVTGPRATNPFSQLQVRDVQRLMGKRPRSRVFTLDRAGEFLYNDSSSSGSGLEMSDDPTLTLSSASGSKATRAQLALSRRQLKALKKINPHARGFVGLPLWDSERRRYLAYCVCWSSSSSRHLKADGDLGYLRIFANSVAVALSHIDAIASNKAKDAFVSSISHELRSPLHGILSATKFLEDGSMSRFEREMVAVISNCGRTLLDTVDHVMDFSKLSSLASKKRPSRHRLNNSAQVRGESADPQSSLTTTVDFPSLVEEVVDAVAMGFNVQHDFLHDDDNVDALSQSSTFHTSGTNGSNSQRIVSSRGRIRLVLEIPHRKSWHVRIQAGAWRRVLMNLFGNALKYTEEGLILVKIEPHADDQCEVLPLTLHVVDTGRGISAHYLETRLYDAFSQEDSISSGSGLGLAIVKQIVDSAGGIVNFKSAQGLGTHARVNFSIPVATSTEPSLDLSAKFETQADRLQNYRVFIVADGALKNAETPKSFLQAETEFARSLTTTLKQWFGVDATVTNSWPTEDADLVICLTPSLKHFETASTDQIGRQPIIIVTYDTLEMASLRTDARITRENAVIEIINQPLGPHKLARVLQQSLDRFQQLSASSSGSKSTLPVVKINGLEPAPAQSRITLHRSRPSSQELYRDPFVLIVDDNDVNLRLLSVFVKKQCLKYHEARNGREAVDIVRAARSSVRCILMDISMPVLDGIAATRLIREFERQQGIKPPTPVIALTGLTSAASRTEAHEAGVDDYLVKPIRFTQVAAILKSANWD